MTQFLWLKLSAALPGPPCRYVSWVHQGRRHVAETILFNVNDQWPPECLPAAFKRQFYVMRRFRRWPG